jgi:hypothetical protein
MALDTHYAELLKLRQAVSRAEAELDSSSTTTEPSLVENVETNKRQ